MHKEILSEKQHELLPLLRQFGRQYYLAGGTAVALHIGHRRSKWKDYVDLYFILKYYLSIDQISTRATQIFDQLFSEKLFRVQLNYFSDIDYSESVDYMTAPVPEEEVRAFLTRKSLEIGF